jgi:hypothetical protein
VPLSVGSVPRSELVHGSECDYPGVTLHALVQDTSYRSLIGSRSQQLHGVMARALKERFPDIVATAAGDAGT